MKSVFKYMFILIALLSFNIHVKADLQDYSGGGSGNTGELSSGGEWYSKNVGIKVSIVNSSNEVEDVEIFLNSSGKGGANFSYDNNPKTHQNTKITWTESKNRTTYEASFLPDRWRDSNNNTINLYSILTEDNYKNLKTLLKHTSLKDNVGTGDYIYIEPMVKIGSYYGTAFEMTNAFLKNNECTTDGKFCYDYSSAVFGGNNKGKRGVLYTTLYVSSDINGVYASDGTTRDNRNDCFKTNKCGRGIGIFKYDDIYPQGKVKITIYDNVTKKPITNPNRQATYDIYSGSDCGGSIVINDVKTSSSSKTLNLNPGTYSIKEVSHPSGYAASTNKCVKTSVSISVGNTTNADIYYEPTCEVELESSDKSVTSLMNLYNKYKSRGLLNFSNPICSNDKDSLCDVIKLKKDNLGCLTAINKLNTIFDQNNLSCYDQIVTSDSGSMGFCVTNFSLVNNLGANTFSGIAGQFLIKKERLDSVSTAKTLKTCYIYNQDLYTSYSDVKKNKIGFGDNNNDDIADELKNYDNKVTQNSTYIVNEYFRKYIYEETKDYYLNSVYLEKLTGKISLNKTNSTYQDPIYGVVAKFKKGNSYIPFKLTYDEDYYNIEECKYNTKEEIIKYEDSSNGKLDLEFRLIDIKNPFDRDTNTNWCDETGNCKKDNDLVNSIIFERNNSYNSTNARPIYKIILTPDDIKIIRKYNKDNEYSYYNTIKNKDGIYVNSFVYDLKTGPLNKYEEDGNVKKSYGILNNKLIVNK